MKARSLNHQIDQVAKGLDGRKRTIVMLSRKLRHGIRDSLVSPKGLAVAGGAGYLLSEWMLKPGQAKPAESERSPAAARRARSSLMSSGLLLVKFALQLRRRWLEQTSGPLPAPAEQAGPVVHTSIRTTPTMPASQNTVR